MRKISISLEDWLDNLLSIRATNTEKSKSQVIRELIKNALVRSVQATPDKIGYYNDSEGILRSVNK